MVDGNSSVPGASVSVTRRPSGLSVVVPVTAGPSVTLPAIDVGSIRSSRSTTTRAFTGTATAPSAGVTCTTCGASSSSD